jgi:TPR repeat protein
MAGLVRGLLPFALAAALAACGGAKTEEVKPEAEVAKPINPKEAAEAAAAKVRSDKLAEQKPEFDAALAANDEAKIDDLADAGNGWALLHRGQTRLSSQDFSQQQGGFADMEAAANKGVAEAQFWLGTKMAYGQDGYPLKPNSGLMMMERAARQGHVQAIMAVGLMYEQDSFMADKKKAREWYERGVAQGSEDAKKALERMDGGGAPEADEGPGDSGDDGL